MSIALTSSVHCMYMCFCISLGYFLQDPFTFELNYSAADILTAARREVSSCEQLEEQLRQWQLSPLTAADLGCYSDASVSSLEKQPRPRRRLYFAYQHARKMHPAFDRLV